jgi:hypothetical protein
VGTNSDRDVGNGAHDFGACLPIKMSRAAAGKIGHSAQRRPEGLRQMTSTATVEETPEQVLARLEQYAASIGITAPRSVPVVPVPLPSTTSQELRQIGIEAMGYVVGLACCVAAIFTFQRLDQAVATAITFGLVLGGALATTRRVPLALWWTLGFAIGGVLARLS